MLQGEEEQGRCHACQPLLLGQEGAQEHNMSYDIPGHGLVSLCYCQQQVLGHGPHCKTIRACAVA